MAIEMYVVHKYTTNQNYGKNQKMVCDLLHEAIMIPYICTSMSLRGVFELYIDYIW